MKELLPECPHSQDPRALNILLVEDSDDHAAIVLRVFSRVGPLHHLHRVSNGVEALEYLAEGHFSNGLKLPDLILLDLKLPQMDGHEFLSEVKKQDRLKQIPVVVLTTSDTQADRQKAYRLQASSYLIKPYNLDEFRNMLQAFCAYWGQWNSF